MRLAFLLLAALVLSLGGSTTRAAYSPEIIDPREYGARCDGTTDDTAKLQAAINAAQAKKANIMWPAATCYAATGLTVTKSIGIIGQNFLPRVADPVAGGGAFGSSRLLCPPSAGVTCLKLAPASPTDLTAVHVENMTISGSGTLGSSAVAGSIGLSTFNGGGYIFNNVQVENFDTCMSFVAQGAGGITFRLNNPFVLACKSHYMIWDGVPDAQIMGGQIGSNNDYPTVQDAILFTRTQTLGAGGGPNTINFLNTNVITGANLACFIKWGGYANTSGLSGEFRFRDMHMENHTAGSTGTFCSDATVPALEGLWVDGMNTATFNTAGGTYRRLFAFDPKTALSGVYVSNSGFDNCFYSGAPNMFNLSPAPVAGPALHNVNFSHNGFCIGPTFTSNGVGENTLFSNGNSYGDMTIAGAWTDFESVGDRVVTLTDTATGRVAFAGAHPQTWTPAVTFSSSGTAGITYNYSTGLYQRTAEGGYTASFNLVLTGLGAASGFAGLTGIPLNCETVAQSSGAMGYYVNMTGLTGGLMMALPAGANPTIALYQAAATGMASVTAANFTASTTLVGEVHCARTH